MDFSEVTPVRRLALAYARADVKAAWALLLALDMRIGDVVLNASEPLIAQLKIAWWNDAISAQPSSRPKGEPLLWELSRLEPEQGLSGLGDAMAQVVDGWGSLLASETWSDDVLASHARQRGQAVFGRYLAWTGQAEAETVGVHWAIDDLAARSGESLGSHPSTLKHLPRPLSILAMAARQQLAPGRFSGMRLVLHGLTGL